MAINETWIRVIVVCAAVILPSLVLLLFAGLVQNIRLESRNENIVFKNGTMPEAPLNGFYKGIAQTKTSWQGKKFDEATNSGINVFSRKYEQKYSFKTSSAQSVRGSQQVLKLDYNVPGNPWWLRLIVDELVETNSGKYQGKVYAKLGPLVFNVTYFSLTKAN